MICVGSIHWHPTPDDPFGDLEIAGQPDEPPAEDRLSADEAAAEAFLESVRAVAPELLN
ncbi:MAG: hypothetical protein GX657_01865 [Chloroflexi bacterium]|nr:hypothetical protein [Chloroflexota bacterium]